MKRNLLKTLLLIFISARVSAQWNIDPNNPTIVSNETCAQRNVKQIPDGEGGTFVFWTDSRSGCSSSSNSDIYSQHYDANGYAQWEEDGRMIINDPGHIWSYDVTLGTNGEIIVAWAAEPGSFDWHVSAQRIDANGSTMWANDLLLLESDGCAGNYVLGISNIQIITLPNSIAARMNVTYCGGSNGNRILRFDTNGNLFGPEDGTPEGNQYYNGNAGIDSPQDGSDDLYLFYTNGNGQGAHASAMRISADGDTLFGPLDVLEGTNGLNYQFWGLSDESGLAVCFLSNGNNGTGVDLFLRKLNPDGTWAWGGNTITVCGANGNQGSFDIKQDEDYYYICWADGRPEAQLNYALYAQKINKATGGIEWTQDGVEVQDVGSYLPRPKIQVTDDGNVVAFHEASAPYYFNATLILADGTLGWNESVVLHNSLPFYDDYSVINSNGNIITAWAQAAGGGGADNIFIARVHNTNTVNMTEIISACDNYTSHGETFTNSGTYVQEVGDTVLTIELTINYSYQSSIDTTSCFEYIFGDNTYSSSGIYTITDQTISGCDSVTTIYLTIADVNTNVDVINATLTAEAENSTYSWIDCSDNSNLGVFDQSFTPAENGSYAVNIMSGECSATSDCIEVIVDDITDHSISEEIIIYPNPANDQFQIQLPVNIVVGEIKIYDNNGKLILAKGQNDNNILTYDVSDYAPGLYHISINSNDIVHHLILMKN